jgi:hypothetical protein
VQPHHHPYLFAPLDALLHTCKHCRLVVVKSSPGLLLDMSLALAMDLCNGDIGRAWKHGASGSGRIESTCGCPAWNTSVGLYTLHCITTARLSHQTQRQHVSTASSPQVCNIIPQSCYSMIPDQLGQAFDQHLASITV